MIEPINQNLNIKTASRLEPVEVPHFTGITKVSKNDTFERRVKNTAKAPNGSMNTAFEAVKKGTKDGIKVIADVTKKSAEFTKEFAGSLYSDITGIAKEKGIQTISTIDGIV